MGYEVTTFGEAIWQTRVTSGKNQETFADDLGVNRATLSSWETNRATPSPKMIRLLIDKGVINVRSARTLMTGVRSGYPVGSHEAVLTLSPPKTLINEGVTFGLLYIRKGHLEKDLWKQKSVNLKIGFQPLKTRGQPTFVATVRQPDRMGFQFKCYADFEGIGWRQVAKALKMARYIPDTHPADGTPGRLFFLLPDEEIIEGPPPKRIKDNYHFPE